MTLRARCEQAEAIGLLQDAGSQVDFSVIFNSEEMDDDQLSTLEDEAGTSEEVSPGNLMGEAACLTGEPRNSTLTARGGPATVYVLGASALADLRKTRPALILLGADDRESRAFLV